MSEYHRGSCAEVEAPRRDLPRRTLSARQAALFDLPEVVCLTLAIRNRNVEVHNDG
ncbi:hypothetical protein HBB16_20310, partial [Pseudonocardia sp. MCCB 268]|nr:hypothetical protein [Pseudonocardia cytotoxica]